MLVLCVPARRQVIPRSRRTGPEPAVPAWAYGTDGAGPALLSPDGAPARWLLMNGYVYDIRDDQDHRTAYGGSVMPGEAANGAKSTPLLRTLADKVNWLISTAHPAGRGPYSNAEVAAPIRKTTGERVSHTTIWKLRSRQATNPQKRLIETMARTFGVRPSFFVGDHDENQADPIQEEAETRAMIGDASITADQLRPFLRLSPQARAADRRLRHRCSPRRVPAPCWPGRRRLTCDV